MNENEISEGKTVAAVSYILLIGVLIALSINADKKNKFTSFHIRQALGLTIGFIGIGLIISNFNTPHIILPFWVCFAILFSYGIITSLKGQAIPIPVIGEWFQKFFKNL